MMRLLSRFCSKVGEAWCVALHDNPGWPVNGRYVCRTCYRVYPIPWAGTEQRSASVAEAADGSDPQPRLQPTGSVPPPVEHGMEGVPYRDAA
ncbi:MAG: hypothetical protein ACK5AZ_17155 [Bryobacteraceae bacterium]